MSDRIVFIRIPYKVRWTNQNPESDREGGGAELTLTAALQLEVNVKLSDNVYLTGRVMRHLFCNKGHIILGCPYQRTILHQLLQNHIQITILFQPNGIKLSNMKFAAVKF